MGPEPVGCLVGLGAAMLKGDGRGKVRKNFQFFQTQYKGTQYTDFNCPMYCTASKSAAGKV